MACFPVSRQRARGASDDVCPAALQPLAACRPELPETGIQSSMRRCQAAQGHVSQRGGRLAAPSTPHGRTDEISGAESGHGLLSALAVGASSSGSVSPSLARCCARERCASARLPELPASARAPQRCALRRRTSPRAASALRLRCVCAASALRPTCSALPPAVAAAMAAPDAAAACAARLILALRSDVERRAPTSLRLRPEARTTSICRPARDLRCCLPRLLSVPHVGVPRGEARPAADAAPRQAFLSWSGSSRRACARSRSGSMTILRWCWLCRCDAAVLQLQRLRCTTVSKYRASVGASAHLATLEAGRPSSAARACAAAPSEAQARAAGARRQSTLRCRRSVVLGRPQGPLRCAPPDAVLAAEPLSLQPSGEERGPEYPQLRAQRSDDGPERSGRLVLGRTRRHADGGAGRVGGR